MLEQFDVYCERTDFSFWSEPVNAVTNLAFVVAALVAFLRRPRGPTPDWPALFLMGVVAAVGIGSFLFHTFATRWASLADTIPITVFIYGFFLVAMQRLFRLPFVAAALATVLFFLAARYATPLLRPLVGYSAGYLPGLIGLAVTGGLLALLKRPGALQLLAAAGLFAASLGFRIADVAVCAGFPLGTHFLWHLVNAVVLYILVRVISENRIQPNKQNTG